MYEFELNVFLYEDADEYRYTTCKNNARSLQELRKMWLNKVFLSCIKEDLVSLAKT